jgi:hypothetical protein
MRLIPNYRKAWRMFSVQAQAVAVAVIGAWQVIPDDIRAIVPPEMAGGLLALLLVLGIAGRLIDQPKVRE